MSQADPGFNPYRKPWVQPHPNQVAGKGAIERPGEMANIIWQNRSTLPTEYENRLGDALEKVFGNGAESLAEVVAGLNALGMRAAHGQRWSEASFQEEMKRLGAK